VSIEHLSETAYCDSNGHMTDAVTNSEGSTYQGLDPDTYEP